MKLTTGILAIAMMAGGAWAQNPTVIDNGRSTLKAVEQKQASDSKAASAAAGQGQSAAAATSAAKPTPGAPAPAVKPAIIPVSKPAAPAKATAKAASAAAPSKGNQLQRVNVVHNADEIQIEISSREAVKARVSDLKSPARVVVELPETVMATAQNHIPVGSSGVKGVRIGMDGKTPPTTSVVVDLDKACAYELTPGPSDKFVLTLHTQAVAKNSPAPVVAKTSAPAAKPPTAGAKPVVAAPVAVAKSSPAPVVTKTSAPAAKPQTATAKPVVAAPSAAPKVVAGKPAAPKAVAQAPKPQVAKAATEIKAPAPAASKPAADVAKGAESSKQPKPEDKKWAMNGKRDPFFSPVVQQTGGSGCSTGKKCLEIGAINLKGVVKSDAGFIAVVTNSLNKAYFLRENDPVFNGYVVKITGDSVVFQETVQDKLGKPFTREVTKRIFTPAV